ncbi:MAG: 3-ketoacyl-CoA thiolase, partial [Halosimplex sp.]
DLAAIAAKNHANAAAYPRAMFDEPVAVDRVMDSEPVAPPLKLYDCAPVTDGAAAVLVARPEVVDRLGAESVRVAGVGTAANTLAVAEKDLTSVEGAAVAADRAYQEAGVDPDDVDVAEVHDAFTVCEALLAEAAGFAPEGRGVESARDPAERSAGWTDVHLNTSGGLKARGHPIGATGLVQAVEAYEQLLGRAGDRQVPGADTALLVNEGGLADAHTAAHVLEGPA